MGISLKGFDEKVVTLEAASGVEAGNLVKISANKKVSACSAGDLFCGVALSVRDGFASVQVGGYVTVNCEDTSIAVGYKTLSAADTKSSTNVAVDSEGGRSLLVVDVDATAKTAGIIL